MTADQLCTALARTPAPAGNARASLPQRLRALAALRASPARAWRDALQMLVQDEAAPYGAVQLRLTGGIIEQDFHQGETDPAFWRAPVVEYLADTARRGVARARLLSARSASLKIALLAAPLQTARGATLGALVIVRRVTSADEVPALLARFEALVTTAAAALLDEATPAGETSTKAGLPSAALARAATVGSTTEFAYSLVNGVRNRFGLEQVALGRIRRDEVHLLCISGLDDIKANTPGVLAIRAAMEECFDQREPVVADDDSGRPGAPLSTGHLLHKRWHAQTGAGVASFPLSVGGEIVGVVSIRHRGDERLNSELLQQVRDTVTPFAAALQLIYAARRGLGQHLRDALHQATRALFGPGAYGRKALAVALVFAAFWFCFFTTPYEIRVPAVVAPRNARVVAMPYDGRVAEVFQTVGDTIAAGAPLCRLDTDELTLQRAELVAEARVYEQQKLAAQAAGERVQASLAEASENLARARLAAVERRINAALIRAPLAGVVVRGDLRPQIDSTLRKGEKLFEVAPADERRLELRIPDHAAGELKHGLRGRFVTQARPDLVHDFRVERVRPAAETIDGQTVYVAEAESEMAADWMRPGMEGFARVELGRRQVWWVALHGVLDYLRLHFWL